MAGPEVIVKALYDYDKCKSVDGSQYESIRKGQSYYLINKDSDEWWSVRHPRFRTDIFVPAAYLEEVHEGVSPTAITDEDNKNDIFTYGSADSPEHIYVNVADIQASIYGEKDDAHYCNWEYVKDALKRPPPKPGDDVSPSKELGDNWLVYEEATVKRNYYYNTETKESTWKPPRGIRNKPPSLQKRNSFGTTAMLSAEDESGDGNADAAFNLLHVPASKHKAEKRLSMPVLIQNYGWTEHTDEDGSSYFIHDITGDKWLQSEDENGRTYFYHENGGESAWELPMIYPTHYRRHGSFDSSASLVNELKQLVEKRSITSEGYLQSKKADGTSGDKTPTLLRPGHTLQLPSIPDDQEGDDRAGPLSPEPTQYFTMHGELSGSGVVERSGHLNKTKVLENGKKQKIRWSQSYIVLSGLTLFFYKDQKASVPKANQPSGKPDMTLDLNDAVIDFGVRSDIKSSRKNVISIIVQNGNQYMLQHDDNARIHDWYIAISKNVSILSKSGQIRGSKGSLNESLESDPGCEGLEPNPSPTLPRLFRGNKAKKTYSLERGMALDDMPLAEKSGKIKDRLRMFFVKRPALEILQEQGIIKDSVFGCQSIQKLCDREKSLVPRFVSRCISAIEEKGLEADGIYRINGNLATIQSLRFMVDKEDAYDLSIPDFEVHVLTGALKLFFRELKEPLFTFNQYDAFIEAIKKQDRDLKIKGMRDQIKLLPKANRECMKELFQHLLKVVEKSRENRMQIQNVAMVFGPTLMWPQIQVSNLALSMVYQNQVIECILLYFKSIF